MLEEAGLAVAHDETLDEHMAFPSVDDAVDAAIFGGPLAGLYANRLRPEQQREVRDAMAEHVSGLAEASDGQVLLPAEVRVAVAEKPRSSPG
jgi:hypothetical protein